MNDIMNAIKQHLDEKFYITNDASCITVLQFDLSCEPCIVVKISQINVTQIEVVWNSPTVLASETHTLDLYDPELFTKLDDIVKKYRLKFFEDAFCGGSGF